MLEPLYLQPHYRLVHGITASHHIGVRRETPTPTSCRRHFCIEIPYINFVLKFHIKILTQFLFSANPVRSGEVASRPARADEGPRRRETGNAEEAPRELSRRACTRGRARALPFDSG